MSSENCPNTSIGLENLESNPIFLRINNEASSTSSAPLSITLCASTLCDAIHAEITCLRAPQDSCHEPTQRRIWRSWGIGYVDQQAMLCVTRHPMSQCFVFPRHQTDGRHDWCRVSAAASHGFVLAIYPPRTPSLLIHCALVAASILVTFYIVGRGQPQVLTAS